MRQTVQALLLGRGVKRWSSSSYRECGPGEARSCEDGKRYSISQHYRRNHYSEEEEMIDPERH